MTPLRGRLRPPRSLRARLTAGLLVLLGLACAAVGVVTVLALHGFLIGRVDQQLTASGGRFAASLEHEARPDSDNLPDTRGQAAGTFGARLLDGRVTQAAVVDDTSQRSVPLGPGDIHTLGAVRPDARGHSVKLSALGHYRVVAAPGDDGDVLITGLPLHPVEETVHRLEAVEAVVFGAALITAGCAAALWVRFSLRPLEQVARTATEVTRLPLATGEVAMPEPVPYADPDTEVGRVATALNRMLGHVGDALTRRHVSEKRLRAFAADASHELRTPVATIRAHTELALRHPGPVPDEVRHALGRVAAESHRMSALVDDLLLLARLDAGRPLDRQPVDLTRVVLDVVDDVHALSPGHRWELDLPEDPVSVPGDEHRLHQVVANLLANARLHTPSGTHVVVALTADTERAELTVTDDGPGIPRDLLPDIFRRFSRADTGRSRRTGSTGLGLAIVDAVTHAHGGTVTVESRPGRTRFRLLLPTGPCPAADDGAARPNFP
ncbi:HAMP domain-containing sensor histidine kinase [Streptomyces sp. A1136]|uniref:sensor histidine kinase n=1 Tax=Streptomyces sp. A1136 TaxID=2563102 RepID=UPI00109E9A88|nr:HAMP domain-containing sensor histidine kinase [Streptomyces sp. A1136]THA50650.1 HAMP domain-containing histidine kinase [Streptomyces sp. A1136]